jgi:hypothetical protein
MQVTADHFTSDSPLSHNPTGGDTHSDDDQGYAEYFRLAGIKNVRGAQQLERYDATDEVSDQNKRPAEGGLVL